MRVFNITNLDGVSSVTPIEGSLALRDFYLWPASATFSDTKLIYLKCNQLDETQIFHNSGTSTVMSVIPLEYSNNKLIKFNDIAPIFHSLTKRSTIYKLQFSIEDQHGNKLPFDNLFITILNK